MTAKKQAILAAASLLAFGLWVGGAAAGEPNAGDPAAADLLDVTNAGQLGTNEMSSTNGGQAITQISSTKQDADVTGNDMTIGDNSSVATGSATSISSNTGGLNVNMTNTGNYVVMQNTTNLNIYLGPQQ
jgi:hypothetical protein